MSSKEKTSKELLDRTKRIVGVGIGALMLCGGAALAAKGFADNAHANEADATAVAAHNLVNDLETQRSAAQTLAFKNHVELDKDTQQDYGIKIADATDMKYAAQDESFLSGEEAQEEFIGAVGAAGLGGLVALGTFAMVAEPLRPREELVGGVPTRVE